MSYVPYSIGNIWVPQTKQSELQQFLFTLIDTFDSRRQLS